MSLTVRKSRRGKLLVWSGLVLFLIAIISMTVGVALPYLAGGSSSAVTTTPTNTPASDTSERAISLLTPRFTPVPTATPTSEPTPWEWMGAHLTVTSPEKGVLIDTDLVRYTAEDRARNGDSIEPPEKNMVIWNASVYETYEISSYPSASAQYCVHIAGHSYSDGSATFNRLASLPIGGKAVITTGNGEVLSYVKQADDELVRKSEQGTHPAINDWSPQPGCLKLITCMSEGEYDMFGHSISLRVTTLWLEDRP